jgi:hypothetical protein
MRYTMDVEDDGEAGESTPWSAVVRAPHPTRGSGFAVVYGQGYGSTPAAAAKAAVEEWVEAEQAEQLSRSTPTAGKHRATMADEVWDLNHMPDGIPL